MAQVETEEQLAEWIRDNVPYDKNVMAVPEGFTTETCKAIAREKNYSFLAKEDAEILPSNVSRLTNILNFATFPEVASDLSPINRKGLHFVGICPHCHERSMVIEPRHQIYKCFGCGETGNVINYVMAERGLKYDDALNYLESKYCNNN